ncbi:MAG TPA: SGNH/GDSL hydrolase family protein [Stackebrandtia sp.]|uniref:SGNH/GDSL hydrolase family protein n=1 Tax=Stackebrandtia sp. TaxID=2023065 RepID=UPI002D319027|nr:SGNH/GDSL hydrolase family protein [Stackebrandtia sp.]HZE38432.1 SGNH/GDSL hydrolase family protein [Stackebrandtia sp.]
MLSRWIAAIGVAIVLVIPASAPAVSAPSAPSSMAALGDSLTRGFNACGWLFDCEPRSWSTGDNPEVNSHYWRILAQNPAIEGNAFNDAQTGSKSDRLPGQAAKAVRQHVEYVTILIGGNDACSYSAKAMTSPKQFRANVDKALETLHTGLPKADVFIASVPDVVRLWDLGHGNSIARKVWDTTGICRSVLTRPTGMTKADVERRDMVGERVDDYNTQLAAACEDYGPRCKYDGGALHDYRFSFGQISRWDYFHLNVKGQAAIADLTYRAGFDW